MLRTVPAHYYLTPSDNEVKQKAIDLDMDILDIDLAKDLANFHSGGRFIPLSVIKEQVEKDFNITFRIDSDGDYADNEGNYWDSLEKARESGIERQIDYHRNVIDFIKKLNVDGIPGNTSLEKSLNTIKILQESDINQESSHDIYSKGLGLPLFRKRSKEVKKIVENINDNIEVLKKIKREDLDSLHEDLKDANPLERIQFLLDNRGLVDILKYSTKVDAISSINTDQVSKLIPDKKGDIKISRGIRDFSELKSISPKELVDIKSLPIKVLNHKIPVIERFKKETKLPFVCLIIDDSGSMQSNHKYLKALGILYNILKRVEKGECSLLFSFFEQKCHKFYLFNEENKEEIKDFWNKEALPHSFNNEETDVANSISQMMNEFKVVLEKFPNVSNDKRHLLVVNDGEDDVSDLKLENLEGCKLHGFILQSSNQDLERICLQSNGSYRENL